MKNVNHRTGDAEKPCAPRQSTHVHTEAQREEENNDEKGDSRSTSSRSRSITKGVKVKTRHLEIMPPVITKKSHMSNNRKGHKLTGTTLTRGNEAKTRSNRSYHDERMDLCLKPSHQRGMKKKPEDGNSIRQHRNGVANHPLNKSPVILEPARPDH